MRCDISYITVISIVYFHKKYSLRKYQPNEIAAMEGKYQPTLDLENSSNESDIKNVRTVFYISLTI